MGWMLEMWVSVSTTPLKLGGGPRGRMEILQIKNLKIFPFPGMESSWVFFLPKIKSLPSWIWRLAPQDFLEIHMAPGSGFSKYRAPKRFFKGV